MPHSSSRQDPGTPLTATAHPSRKVLSCHCSSLSEALGKKTKTNKAKQTNTATRTGDTGLGSSRASRGGAAVPSRCPEDTGAPLSPSPSACPHPGRQRSPRAPQGEATAAPRGAPDPGRCALGGWGRVLDTGHRGTPEPAASWVALPRRRPCLTRRLALSPAALAMRWSSAYFSASRGCSEESAMTPAPTERPCPPAPTDTARTAPAVRTGPLRQPICWARQGAWP